ncbi:MAG: hypothetical protein HND27_00185 [Bacteroidetes bacterium]|nr:hypothetical protein [Bacteroidota bacterium]MBV6461518.1 hypothetical protein [Flavobacteriales bacterium]MCL4815686.1 hypothetical protein [Flavobacteriales bacterium]NOG94171.1 hypothetical protein [Bacteroidota bacterium]WKZ76487.1 MAG: hypothetical protein QY303_06210 [Vicingaceae bacterium]
MKFETENTPSVVIKKKNIPLLLDYCLENKIEFTVVPKLTVDDFEISFNLKDFKMAIALGMCLKELKLDLLGTQNITSLNAIKATKNPIEIKVNKKNKEVKVENILTEKIQDSKEAQLIETSSSLAFDLEN